MTEKTTNTDRAEIVRKHVSRALEDGFELIYERLDGLHKRDINDDDIIQAMREMGEHDLLNSYAEWGQIELPDAEPNSVMDDVVPDPHDAGSYAKLSKPVLVWFTAAALLDKVIRDLPFSYVTQTGGNTATLVFRKDPEDNAILAGPGVFNWNAPALSEFSTGEFYYGPDTIGLNGDGEPKYDEPGTPVDPQNPGTLDEIAEKIKATYAQYNPEGVAK